MKEKEDPDGWGQISGDATKLRACPDPSKCSTDSPSGLLDGYAARVGALAALAAVEEGGGTPRGSGLVWTGSCARIPRRRPPN